MKTLAFVNTLLSLICERFAQANVVEVRERFFEYTEHSNRRWRPLGREFACSELSSSPQLRLLPNMIDSDAANQRTSAPETLAPGCEQPVKPFTSIISTEEGVNYEKHKPERIRQKF